MATDHWAGLTPEERKLYGLDGDKGASGGSTGALAPTTTAPTQAPPADTGGAATGILPALAGGVVHGGEDVLNAPTTWAGASPWANWQPYATAQGQHPWAAGIGRFLGQVGGAGAAMLGGEALFPELGAGALAARVATNPLMRGVVAGGIGGAEQNLLTAGEDPNEGFIKRGLLGAGGGAVGGFIGGKLGQMFGSEAALAPAVQNAATTAQSHGIDLAASNLPLAGGAASAKGALATVPQQQQINSAFGNILGENVTDFSPAKLGNVSQNIGSQITAAANQGQVTLTPGLANELGQIVRDARSTAYDPTVTGKIEQEVSKITDAFQKGNGVIPGSQFDTIVGAGSRLQKYTSAADNDLSELARRLDTTMDNGFKASSGVDAYNKWVDARTRYRILSAIEDNVEHTGGDINSGSIYADLNRRFPNLPRLTAATGGTVGQAGELANSVRTLFGGGAQQTAAQPTPSLLSRVLTPEGLALTAGAAGYALHNPVAAVGSGLAYLGTKGVGALGRRYQASPGFVNRLIATPQGTNMLMPRWLPTAPFVGRLGVAAAPNTLNQLPGP